MTCGKRYKFKDLPGFKAWLLANRARITEEEAQQVASFSGGFDAEWEPNVPDVHKLLDHTVEMLRRVAEREKIEAARPPRKRLPMHLVTRKELARETPGTRCQLCRQVVDFYPADAYGEVAAVDSLPSYRVRVSSKDWHPCIEWNDEDLPPWEQDEQYPAPGDEG